MPRAVRYDEYGGVGVLEVREVDRPTPGPGEVLVRVEAAGVNPGEGVIREGRLHDRWPATFPSGQGSDLAGVVAAVGAGVDAPAVGDEVFGWTDDRSAQAEYVVTRADQVAPKPADVSWDVAGALHVVGATAWAAVQAVDPHEGDTVVVTGAAGGVGSLTVQLARRAGATVIGLASEANHAWLRDHEVIPIDYAGAHLAERIRAAAPDGRVDALIDTFGSGYVDLAVELGVEPKRIDTIIDWEAAERVGTRTDGNAAGASVEVLSELARLLADGRLDLPIAAVYPLDEVRDAYRQIEQRHTRGKIVLHP